MSRPQTFVGVAAIALLVLALPALAAADPVTCQRQMARQLLKYGKTLVAVQVKCLNKENLGKIPGPCPDAAAQLKIQRVQQRALDRIALACTLADAAALGLRSDCAYESESTGIEGQCAALPVTTPGELAECLRCWKAAELSELVAVAYASHAVALCGGALDATSPVCSNLGCTTPVPDQRDLGDTGENDCQRAIGKAGFKYLTRRAKRLEKCALAGGTENDCESDPAVQSALERYKLASETLIARKCGQRSPSPSLPFCCRTGVANQCTAAATREDCTIGGGTVQEGKTCNAVTNDCDPVGGPNQEITWWGVCPGSAACPGTPLTSRDDLVECLEVTTEGIVNELLCLQFPTQWSCPAEP
jgi:hypothetical protein